MKRKYLKNGLCLIFSLAIIGGLFPQLAKAFNHNENVRPYIEFEDSCEQPINVTINYENGMSTAEVSWDGELPQEGWILLYGNEGGVDLSWLLSDPEGYDSPESNMERVYSSPHTIYANMLHEGPNEVYVVAYCGDGLLIASESVVFEMGEKGQEIIGEEAGCDTPYNVSAVQNDPLSMDISWEPQDGELYQIAWGPNGFEMNEDFFEPNETGTVIVSENPYHLKFPQEDSYGIFIRKFCGDNSFSEWAVPGCHSPSQLESEVSETEVLLSWTAVEGQEAVWQIAYGPEGFNPDDELNFDYASNNPIHTLMLSELEQGIVYDFYVRTDCSSSNFSPWSEPGTFSTEFTPCNPVESLESNHVTHQSSDIYWTAVSSEGQWDVIYGTAPLDESEALTVTVSNPQAILTGLESETTYELYVVSHCWSGETAQSEVISFTTLQSDELYCIPYIITGCMHSSAIDNLIVDGENDTNLYDLNTGCSDSNYENKTDMSVDLAPGNQYFARVSAGNFGTSGNQLAIWIDFNDDGIFDESERVGGASLASIGFTNVNFTIPEGTNPGQHRMRVMLALYSSASNLTPCNNGGLPAVNGEVHDYSVNILSLENCSNVTAGNTVDNFATCLGEDLSISTSGASDPAIGLERKWQSSPAGQNNWTDIDNGLLPTTTIYGGIQQATDFRYVVACGLSGENSTSNVLQVSMSSNCYCIPQQSCIGGSLGGRQIKNVSISGETIDLDNESGGCVGTGFTDYTINFAPDLKQGESYTLWVTVKNGNLEGHRVKAWIDFSKDMIFEDSEEETIMDFPQGLESYTVASEFTVPLNAAPGIYRMRVRMGTDAYGAPPITGCNLLSFGGETEDYLIEVVPGDFLPCLKPSEVTVEQEADPTSATISWLQGGDETQWELIYGLAGFDPNSEEPVVVYDNPSVLISDLESASAYGVYVRSICEEIVSEWTDLTTFLTGSVSVEDLSFESFSYYPNPTDDKLSLGALTPIEEVTILSVSGQKILTFHPSADIAELDVSKLSSGIYFVKVSLKNRTRIFKFIKN